MIQIFIDGILTETFNSDSKGNEASIKYLAALYNKRVESVPNGKKYIASCNLALKYDCVGGKEDLHLKHYRIARDLQQSIQKEKLPQIKIEIKHIVV